MKGKNTPKRSQTSNSIAQKHHALRRPSVRVTYFLDVALRTGKRTNDQANRGQHPHQRTHQHAALRLRDFEVHGNDLFLEFRVHVARFDHVHDQRGVGGLDECLEFGVLLSECNQALVERVDLCDSRFQLDANNTSKESTLKIFFSIRLVS